MALYRKVGVAYWEGELAEANRGDTDSHAVAFYLMTARAIGPIGCCRLSASQIAEDLGIESRRVSEALRNLTERGFVVVDDRFRMVLVVEAARHEWGERPNPADNRVKSLIKMLPELMAVCRKSFVWNNFMARYAEPWAEVFRAVEAVTSEPLPRPSEGLPEGFSRARLQDQDQDQDSCSELAADGNSEPDDDPAIFWIPVVKGNGRPTGARKTEGGLEAPVRASKIAEWKESFPDLDVETQIREAIQWCRDRPQRRKTPGGVNSYIGGWLNRAQNRHGGKKNPQQHAPSLTMEGMPKIYRRPS